MRKPKKFKIKSWQKYYIKHYTFLKNIMINSIKRSITITTLTFVVGIQAQTQQKMDTILLPKIAPECPKQTKLIVPEWSNWAELLKVFQTCSEALHIKVLDNNKLEVHDGINTWIWIYDHNRGSIVPDNLPIKVSKK